MLLSRGSSSMWCQGRSLREDGRQTVQAIRARHTGTHRWLGTAGTRQLQVVPAAKRPDDIGADADDDVVAADDDIGSSGVGEGKKAKPNHQCHHPGCKKRPSYGQPGGRAQFCAQHAPEGTEDVVNKRCQHPGGCTTQPTFGHRGGCAQFCAKHALEGMEDIMNPRCEHPGCSKRPYFGAPGGCAQCCKEHASAGMEDVVSKRCQHEGCQLRPVFGHPGGKARLFCKAHSLEGMVNLNKRAK